MSTYDELIYPSILVQTTYVPTLYIVYGVTVDLFFENRVSSDGHFLEVSISAIHFFEHQSSSAFSNLLRGKIIMFKPRLKKIFQKPLRKY